MARHVGSILCVHPNAEFYGSDRVFLRTVAAFRARWPGAAITVVLPADGELAAAARAVAADVRIAPLVVLRRSRPLATLAAVVRLPLAVWRARRAMVGRDLVYVSTVVGLDQLLALRFAAGATIVHVHELPLDPAKRVIAALLRWTRARLVFVSGAVRDAFPTLAVRGGVVWNGTGAIATGPVAAGAVLRVLLIGRFNAWKGQEVLIDAVASLDPERRRRFEIRLVGDAFAGGHVATAAAQIAAHGLDGTITIKGFAQDPTPFYDWADIVVVPSTRPEPFGLVAIEAMAAARAVIAADHGGLREIVIDGATGRLIPPRDPAALAAALIRYADDPALVRRHGEAGRRRFEALFGEDRYARAIIAVAEDAVARANRRRASG